MTEPMKRLCVPCSPVVRLRGPDDLVRVLPSPDMIHIMVCGDPHRNRLMVLWGGYVNPVTKKMTFPALDLLAAIGAFTEAAYGERLTFEHP